MLNSTHHWYPINSSFFQTIPVHNQNTSPFWNPLYAIIHKYNIHLVAREYVQSVLETRAVPEWLCPLLSTLSLSFFPCLQKADRIPRNHVGASRIAHVFRVFLFFYFSLSLYASPLFFYRSRFISREIHTSGGLAVDWRGRRLVVTRGSHRLHRCWITGALGAAIKLHSGGNVGTRAEQIRRQRMNVAGASISRLFRPRVLCPFEIRCACAFTFGNCINSDNLYTLWNR